MAPRQRTPERGGQGRNAPAPVKSGYRGADGMRKMDEEQARQEADREARKAKGNTPFRFWTPVGSTRQLIIIDEAPDFFRYEHALKDRKSGRFDNFLPCINEDANCPVCGVTDKPSYFAMYLTVIDLEGYEDKDGNWVEWSKKLLVVKPMQQKKIARLYEREGTLRGMILDMTRDSDKDASIGGDIEFVGWAEEDELHDYYTTYVDKDNKTHEIIGDEVFDYEALFPDMTEKQLATIAGADLGDSVGNRRGDDRSIGRGERGGRGGREEAPRGRSASRGGRRGDDDDQGDAPQRPARGSRRDSADDEQRPARGRRAPQQDNADDGYDDDQGDQQDAPQRGTRGTRQAREEAPAQRPQRPARGRREEPADDGQDDQGDAPQRPARGRREAPADDAPQRPARGGRQAPQRPARGRADASHDDPPFEEDGGQDDAPAASPRNRAALRSRR